MGNWKLTLVQWIPCMALRCSRCCGRRVEIAPHPLVHEQKEFVSDVRICSSYRSVCSMPTELSGQCQGTCQACLAFRLALQYGVQLPSSLLSIAGDFGNRRRVLSVARLQCCIENVAVNGKSACLVLWACGLWLPCRV